MMQCRMLGAAVEAWNDAGEPVIGQVGELVCTQPIPSMPQYLVNDPDGARYRASYFEMYPPGHGRKPGGGDLPKEAGSVWRHGDWLRVGDENGEGEWCVIYGRSDATINRHGLRMGTSEIYSAVESILPKCSTRWWSISNTWARQLHAAVRGAAPRAWNWTRR
jgi:acetoacetyl-CoA synthetase